MQHLMFGGDVYIYCQEREGQRRAKMSNRRRTATTELVVPRSIPTTAPETGDDEEAAAIACIIMFMCKTQGCGSVFEPRNMHGTISR